MIRLGRPIFTARPPCIRRGTDAPPSRGAYRTSSERATPKRSRSGWREPVDPAGSAEVDAVVRPDLDRVHPCRRGQQDSRTRRESGPSGVHVDRPDRAGVHVAEHEVPVDAGAQPAPVAERRAGDPDRVREVGLRKVAWGGTAIARVRWGRAAAVLVDSPAQAATLADEI